MPSIRVVTPLTVVETTPAKKGGNKRVAGTAAANHVHLSSRKQGVSPAHAARQASRYASRLPSTLSIEERSPRARGATVRVETKSDTKDWLSASRPNQTCRPNVEPAVTSSLRFLIQSTLRFRRTIHTDSQFLFPPFQPMQFSFLSSQRATARSETF